MSEKKSSTTKPGRKGGTMIHLDKLAPRVEKHRLRMEENTPGSEVTTREAIMNLLYRGLAEVEAAKTQATATNQ
jgi:hypothetical protein